MTTFILPSRELASSAAKTDALNPGSQEMLVLTEDQRFWEKLSAAARETGRKLVRTSPIPNRSAEPAAVLLDLDSHDAWEAADSILRDEHSPPLFLLTSRGEHPDWSGAVQAGSVLDKRTDGASLLRQVNTWVQFPAQVAREIRAAQRSLLGWLKPCAEATPSRQFWRTNE